jgi:roadblock/LC7 domain-containing protein
VPASGGTPTPVTTLDTSRQEIAHEHPFFLPDGRHFLYAAWSSSNAPLGIRLRSLDSKEATPLLEGVASAQYAHGALLFVRETTLMAQAFNVAQQAFTGDAVPVANQISIGQSAIGSSRAGAFSVSETGVLVYQTALSAPPSRLVWLDREGREISTVGDTAAYGDLDLSPDGQRVSVSVDVPGGGNRDVWIFDTVRGMGTRATFDSGNESVGVWSPDGNRFVYTSDRDDRREVYLKAASGAGDAVAVFKNDINKYVMSWSPNGEFLVYISPSAPGGSYDMWTLPLSGDRTPRPFMQTPFNEGFAARFSPDGRWIAYPSDESGRSEVYVAPFPADPSRKRRVSTAGGTTARWGQDGREIFYYEPASGRLMSVPLTYGAGDVNVGIAKPLFRVRRVPLWGMWYDMTRDGQRFLVNTPADLDTTTPLTLVVNWGALLDR